MKWDILVGDLRQHLAYIPDNSVQTVITSPPYFGIRDYKNPLQIGYGCNLNEYIGSLVSVFSEVRRVLRDDGTLWLDLGDKYADKAMRENNLKMKDLIGVPWRVAFALQDAGWYLRSDIVFNKTNPTPEAPKDRPVRCHQYLFLFSKKASYYYDADAIREPCVDADRGAHQENEKGGTGASGGLESGRNVSMRQMDRGGAKRVYNRLGRNKRSVWTMPTQALPGLKHFSIFPEKLVEPCVLAGSRCGDVVLDPFMGSGTVGVVALRHKRSFLGVELNPAHAYYADRRIMMSLAGLKYPLDPTLSEVISLTQDYVDVRRGMS